MTENVKPVRCAIYTRKSTEENLNSEFNSLDAQRNACMHYIEIQKHKGWYALSDMYDDGGFSGGTTDRPALKRLMQDIKAGLIDIVIVYKIDRLSRCMPDFVDLYRTFEAQCVSFVSVTQQFDTSTSTGKLMLNILMSFGQHEREVTQERILYKIAESKKRGMWMGGYAPFGYKVVNKKLVIHETDAENVRLIFSEFIKKKSIMKLAILLREKGITNRNARVNAYFTTSLLYRLLNNPIYIGKVTHKGALYDGQHEPIISDELWQASRRTLEADPRTRSGITKRKIQFVLTGLLKCACCNSSMTPSHTKKKHGKLYRYYVSQAHRKAKRVDCQIKQISATEIEALVFDKLHQMLQTPDVLVETWKQANQHDSHALISEEQVRDALVNINSVWGNLFPAEQERVVNLMVEKVIMQPDSVKLQLKDNGLLSFVQTKIGQECHDHNRDTVSN